jgi:hypothetical protein
MYIAGNKRGRFFFQISLKWWWYNPTKYPLFTQTQSEQIKLKEDRYFLQLLQSSDFSSPK